MSAPGFFMHLSDFILGIRRQNKVFHKSSFALLVYLHKNQLISIIAPPIRKDTILTQ